MFNVFVFSYVSYVLIDVFLLISFYFSYSFYNDVSSFVFHLQQSELTYFMFVQCLHSNSLQTDDSIGMVNVDLRALVLDGRPIAASTVARVSRPTVIACSSVSVGAYPWLVKDAAHPINAVNKSPRTVRRAWIAILAIMPPCMSARNLLADLPNTCKTSKKVDSETANNLKKVRIDAKSPPC